MLASSFEAILRRRGHHELADGIASAMRSPEPRQEPKAEMQLPRRTTRTPRRTALRAM